MPRSKVREAQGGRPIHSGVNHFSVIFILNDLIIVFESIVIRVALDKANIKGEGFVWFTV